MVVVLIPLHSCTSLRALNLTVIVEPLGLLTLLIILSRWLRLLLVRFENSFLGDADEDLTILYLAVLTLER